MPLIFNNKVALAGYCCQCYWLHPLYNDLPAGCAFMVPQTCKQCGHDICGECGPMFGPGTLPLVRTARPATAYERECIDRDRELNEPWTVEWHPIH